MKALRTIGIRKAWRFALEQASSWLLSHAPFPQVRVLLLRLFGARIGKGTIIHNVRFINYYRGSYRHFCTGVDCFIGHECLIDLSAPVILADHVTMSQRVQVLTHMNVGYPDHPLQWRFPAKTESVRIQRGVYIGVGATILCGVTIGECACIAAGAMVTRSVSSGTVARGIPAKAYPMEASKNDQRANQLP